MTRFCFALVVAIFAYDASAAPRKLNACTYREMVALEAAIKDWSADGYPHAYYLKNPQDEVIGFYATNNDSEMYAEVCDSVQTELTTASSWYYWDSSAASTDPRTWVSGDEHRLTQDEGIAYINVLDADRAQLCVMGFGDGDDEVLLMSEVVRFEALDI